MSDAALAGPRRSRREVRREELLDTAVEVIAREGPDVSIEQVANAVGVTRPIIYRYFGDRDGLRKAVAARAARALLDDLRSGLTGPGAGRELVRSAIDSYLSFIEHQPEVYRYLVQGDRREVTAFARTVGRELADLLRARLGAAGGNTRVADAWAFGLVGMVHLAGDWWLDERRPSRRTLAEQLTALVWDGMAAGAPPPTSRPIPSRRTSRG